MQENPSRPNYFATTGMRLLAGRHFNDRDRERHAKVAIVNRCDGPPLFSRDGRAVGRHLGYGKPDIEIVGVVEDARVNRVQDPPEPMAFFPWRRSSGRGPWTSAPLGIRVRS